MSDGGSARTTFLVESLIHQCYHYIAMNMEKFPVSHLSLLPLKIREELLWRLPVADICQLEDTEYVDGFRDMAAYWKLPCEEFHRTSPEDADIARYVEEWDSAEYAKAILYGQVVTALMGCLYDDFFFHLPFDDKLNPRKKGAMILFLYSVRKPIVGDNSGCEHTFPPRYCKKRNLTVKMDVINAVLGCFKEKLPKILAEVHLYEDIDDEYYDLLDKVVYLGIRGGVFPSSNFVEQIVKRSVSLEVVILEGYRNREPMSRPHLWALKESSCLDDATSVNKLITFFSTQASFLSHFRILKILTTNHFGYKCTSLQENLNKFKMAYFSAPTTHLQKIVIAVSDTVLKSNNSVCPVIDQRYLEFKIFELEHCHFALKQKSTHRAIVQKWAPGLLGRKRRHLEEDNKDGSHHSGH